MAVTDELAGKKRMYHFLRRERLLVALRSVVVVDGYKKGPTISDKHVGSTGTHSDTSNVLNLNGKTNRSRLGRPALRGLAQTWAEGIVTVIA